MKKIFAVLLILVAVFASYAPSLQDGFVWDDTALILRDPLIRSWRLIPEGFNHFLFVDATAANTNAASDILRAGLGFLLLLISLPAIAISATYWKSFRATRES